MAALLIDQEVGVATLDERAARRSLLLQVAGLETTLSRNQSEAFPDQLQLTPLPSGAARLQDLERLELLRDALVGAVVESRAALIEREERRDSAQERLGALLLDPRSNRRVRITQRELGVGGCGVWSAVPRLGPMGRLMGWWRVKLSSGCPLAT